MLEVVFVLLCIALAALGVVFVAVVVSVKTVGTGPLKDLLRRSDPPSVVAEVSDLLRQEVAVLKRRRVPEHEHYCLSKHFPSRECNCRK